MLRSSQQQQKKQLESELEDLKTKKQFEFITETKDIQDQLKDFKKELATIQVQQKTELERHTRDVSNATSAYDNYQAQIQVLQERSQSLINDNLALEDKLALVEARIMALNAEITDKIKESADFSREIEELSLTKDNLDNELSIKQSEISDLLTKLDVKAVERNRQINALEHKQAEVSANLADLQRQDKNIREDTAERLKKVAAREEAINIRELKVKQEEGRLHQYANLMQL